VPPSPERDRAETIVVVGDLDGRGRLESALEAPVREVPDADAAGATAGDVSVGAFVVVHDPGESDRTDAVAALSERYPSTPVLAVVESDDPLAGRAVVDAGASSYVPAPAVADPIADLAERLACEDSRAGGPIQVDLFDAIDDPAVIHGTDDGEIRAANDAFCELFGYDRAELLGTDIGAITATDRVEESPEAKVRRAAAEDGETFEWATQRKDGTVVPVEVRLSPVEAAGGEYVVGIVRDISDRKRRERELKAERAFTEATFAALPDVFYAFDESGEFLRWNDRLTEVTGYTDAEIESMHPIEFFPEDERETIAGAIAEVFEEDTTVTVEAPFLTVDGERIPYEFTGGKMVDGDGETLGLVGIGRDISARKRRQRRFEAVFNNTYQFTGLLEPDGTVLEANETALRFGGMDREAVVGKKVWEADWFRTGGETREAVKTAVRRAAEGEFHRTELTVEGRTGTEIIDFSIRPITDDRGEVTLLIPEGRTITELKRRERHLGVLHRFLRHNLRNKLTVIEGNAEVLSRELEDDEGGVYASLIRGAAEDLIELGETAHELSRLVTKAEGDRRPIDVRGMLSTLRSEFEERYPEASVELQGGGGAYVRADWRLETVFEQLIENAVEHAGPSVTVRTETAGGTVRVSVADEGPGIPEEELVGITTDEEPTPIEHGTGFGLWLVRSVLDDYGATLHHEPRSGSGSELIVELPRAEEPPANESEAGERSRGES